MNDSFISLEETATILNVNKQTLRRWDESGKLKSNRTEAGYRIYKYEEVLSILHKVKARPFVKWAGGKTQLVPELLKYIPSHYNRYIEPFVGGGALFFTLNPETAILNDSNAELITTYKVIKERHKELIFLLEDYQKNHNEKLYYKVRALDISHLDEVERAARFIYLNKTCFNGLYRVNQNGQFNTPIGSYKNPKILDEENILKCSLALKKTKLFNLDYKKFLDEVVERGDLVYLDPPYLPVSEYSDFDRYTKEKFKIADHVELTTHFQKLIDKGATPILSNSCSEITKKLYSDYEISLVGASRNISKKSTGRGKVDEIIVVGKNKSNRFPTTRYMGSKSNLLDYISEAIRPLKVKTVFDAFSGSGVVSYHLKQQGYTVISNDFLKYSSSITHALVENKSETLNASDLNSLFEINKSNKRFVQNTFKDLYFSDEDNAFIDLIISNLEKIENSYKKSLVLAALSRACLKRRPRGIFTYVGFKYDDGRKDLSFSLKEHFLFSVADFNRAVFDNGKNNKVYNESIMQLDGVNPDLIYLDPPYFSKHSDNDYVRRYHFIEGICRSWQGLEIQHDTLTKKFKKFESPFNSKESTYEAFEWIFEKYKESKILISYSSNSLPTKNELISMLSKYKKKVEVIEIDYKYSFGNQGHKVKDNNNAVKEYLFLGL